MRKEVLLVVFLLMVFLFVGFISAASISNDIHLNVQVLYSNGTIHPGTYTFTFNISNSSDCNVTNVVYNSTQIIATDSNGVVSVYLQNVTLPFDQQYWLCYYRDGSLIETDKFTRSPYAFRAEYVNLSGVGVDTNLNLSAYNATANYGFFNFLGTLINPIGSIFANRITTSGNISTSAYYLGDGRFLTGITATASPAGNSGAVQYNKNGYTGGNESSFWFNDTTNTVGINGGLVVNGVNWSSSHGAIIASGTDANGFYIKFADGTMIARVFQSISLATNGYGTNYFPGGGFASTPSVMGSNSYRITTSPNYVGSNGVAGSARAINSTSYIWQIQSSSSTYSYGLDVSFIGRWTNLNLGTGSGGSGGIVNTITNSNGTCTEYANGIASCYGQITGSNPAGNFVSGTQGLPITFTSTPSGSMSVLTYSSGLSQGGTSGQYIHWNTNNFNWGVNFYSAQNSVSSYEIRWFAVGRWTDSTNVNTPDYSTWGLDSNGNIVTVNLSKDVNITGKLYVNGSLISNVPEGAVVAFNSADCPPGWIPANGSAGTPDLRGLFVRGAGTSGVLTMANSTPFSAVFGTYQNDSFQGHVMGPSISSQYFDYSAESGAYELEYTQAASSNPHIHRASTTGLPVSAGAAYGNPRYTGETRPASYALTYCVKLAGDAMQSNTIWGTNGGNVTLSNQSQDVSLPNNLAVGKNLTVDGNQTEGYGIIGTITGQGTCVKYAEGTMTCYYSASSCGSNCVTTWTFPTAFSSTSYVVTATTTGSSGNPVVETKTTTSVNIDTGYGGTSKPSADLMAIGKWK